LRTQPNPSSRHAAGEPAGRRSLLPNGAARARRRRFAILLAPVAVLLIGAGVLLAGRPGILHVIGLLALAYGIGLVLALVPLAGGRNPAARN
jgi:hypothetical protein